MRLNDAFPSNYLKADDLEEADVIVTITGCEIEELGKEKERKPVLTFRGTDKKMVLNKTNWQTIAKVLGTDETDEWIGKRITLFTAQVESFGETVLAIRVRLKAPAQQAQAQSTTTGASSAKAALRVALDGEHGGAPQDDEIPF